MRREVAVELRAAAEKAAEIFSNRSSREVNEEFKIDLILPLSETAASVSFLKSGGKKALSFFYYMQKKWFFFFPTDSHILGMGKFVEQKNRIEAFNYPKNFEEPKVKLDPEHEKFIDEIQRERGSEKSEDDDDIPF